MNKYDTIIKFFLIAILMIFITPLMAQGPGSPPATPIDGGLSLLLAAGVAYGSKQVIKHNKGRKK